MKGLPMNRFSTAEKEYMHSQRLGRLATVNAAGEPHVVPVSFRYNAELDMIDIGGHGMSHSKKFRDILHNANVAFVIDDVLPPWQPRFLEIRGRAEQVFEGGQEFGSGFAPEMIRISPRRIISGGIEPGASSYAHTSRKVE
jgi:pyridoxamine 5'-phosphate oxidase family protein